MSISKIKLADNTVYEIIPHKLTDSTYTVTLPTLTADSTFALSSDLSSYLPLTGGTLTGDLSFSYGKGINNVYSISCYELSAQELNSPLIKNVSALTFGNTNYQFKLPYSGSSILELACNSTSNNVLSVKHNDDDTAHTIEFATTTSLSDGTNSVTIADIANKQDKITSSNKLSSSLVDGLSTVATSGSYNDLSDKPTIPTYELSGNNATVTLTPSSGSATSITVNNVANATTATNLTNTPSLLTSGNTIAVKAGEKTSSYITVPYATKAASDGSGNNIVNTYMAHGYVSTDMESDKRIWNSMIDDGFASFAKRYYIIVSIHPITVDGTTYPYVDTSKEITDDNYIVDSTASVTYNSIDNQSTVQTLFDGSSDTGQFNTKADNYIKVRLLPITSKNDSYSPSSSTSTFFGYPYGKLLATAYYGKTPTSIMYSVYNKHSLWTTGWHIQYFTATSDNYRKWELNDYAYYSRTEMVFRFIGNGSSSSELHITELSWYLTRPTDLSIQKSVVTNLCNQDLYNDFTWKQYGTQKAKIEASTGNGYFNNIYENNTLLSNKYQTKLSTSQLSAANSGITSTKVSTYDGYSTTISNKADKTAAVNSLSVSGTTLLYKDVNGTQLGSVTLPSSTDTKNTAGSSNSTSKLFLVGTTSQSSTGVQSYSNKNVYETNGSLYATTFYENNTALSSKYLRLAGGTVTGDVTFNNNSYFNNIYATTSTWGDASASSLDVSTGTITANKFIKTNGTSSEFLKADGSTDTNEYQVKLISGTNIKTVNGNSLLGYGNIEISGGSSYTLPTATSSVLGGVKLGSDTVQTVSSNAVTTTSSRTYAIQKNSSGQMVVNVPWTDTDTHKYPFVANYGTSNLEVNLVFTEWTPLLDYSSSAAADAVHAKGFMTIYWPPTSGGPTVTNKQFLSWLSDEYFSDTEIEHANGTVRLVYSDVDSQSDSYIIWGTDVSDGSWDTFTPYTLDVTCSSTSTNYIRKSCVNSFSSSGTGSIKTLYTSSLYGINITNDSSDEAHITFEFDLVITNHSGY